MRIILIKNKIFVGYSLSVNSKLMTNFMVKGNKMPKTILLNDFSSGVYFYKAVSGGKMIQSKLVIIK
jgi:hypothetical protein